MFKRTTLFAAALLLPALCVAQTARRPMTFEDLQKVKRLGETAVSPDGKWLVYGATSVDLARNKKSTTLWVQPVAGGDPQPLANMQPGDGGIQFSADGRQILFSSARAGNDQVWIAGFDAATGQPGVPRKLTNVSTGTDNARWAPNGQFVVFTSTVYPDCPAIKAGDGGVGDECNAERDTQAAESKVKAQIFTHLLYRHWDHYTGAKRSHLFVADVATGAVHDLTPNDPHDVPPFALGGDGGFSISPDSKELAFTENPDAEPATSVSAQIYTLDLTNAAAKPVRISTSKGGNFNPAYSPDGKSIAWRSEDRAGYESAQFRLSVYDRATRTERDLLPKLENWVDEFAWAPDAKSLYLTSGTTGESPVFVAGLDGTLTTLAAQGEFSSLHPLADGKTVVASRMTVAQPSEVVLVAAAGVQTLTHLNDALLAQLDLPKMQSYWFTAADGTKLQGFVIPPPAFDPARKYPVKFLIHGGPQGAWGDAWSYRWNPELFAANGYVVVMVNPRGSTGYGQKVVDGVNGDWGGKPFSDLMLGLDYAEQHFSFIDKTRECALGASYGGYMANWVLGHTDRFKCIVSHDGMFNPESAFGTTEEDWFNVWEFKGHPWDYYGKPDSENPFRKWSPAMSARNFKTPTLVIHGQLDYRLDVSEGFQLFDTLQLLGVPSKMLYFPDEGHWVLKPQNSQLWYKTVNDWVDQWTKK